jgi:hypothetical protein
MQNFTIGRMHASNLLKAVLKPRSITSSSERKTLNTKDSNSRGRRPSSPDSGLHLIVNKKSGPVPKPVKMSCLCAPTNHAGSFRCRLHRGNQQSWGGKNLGPSPTTPKSPTATTTKGSSPMPIDGENGSSKRVVHQLPITGQPLMSFSPPGHRSSEPRPSRLSRVSAASDVEAPSPEASAPAPPAPKIASSHVRYLKYNGGASCANGAVIDGGMMLVKKLQTGGKSAMHEVFGSGTAMSRAALSL